MRIPYPFEREVEQLLRNLEPHQFASGPAVTNTGLSVTVIHEAKVVGSSTFGFRDRARALPVTPDTVFPIASVTKSFTAALVLQLCREFRINITDPLAQIWPELKIGNPNQAPQLSILDVLAHKSALPRNDFLWHDAKLATSEILNRLQFLPLDPADQGEVGQAFRYNNLLYGVLGRLAEKLTGHSWASLIESRIFLKLPRRGLWTEFKVLPEDTPRALPYARELLCDEFEEWTVPAAASIWATSAGVAEWLILQMERGRNAAGEQVLDSDLIDLCHQRHHSLLNSQEVAGAVEVPSYGLGWFSDELNGEPFYHHGGNIDGASAFAGYCPARKIGAVVLANQTLSKLPRQLGISILSLMLKIPAPKFDRFVPENRFRPETVILKPELTSRAQPVPLQLPASFYGRYENLAYGDLEIFQENANAFVRFHQQRWPVLKQDSQSIVIGRPWLGINSEIRILIDDHSASCPWNLFSTDPYVRFVKSTSRDEVRENLF